MSEVGGWEATGSDGDWGKVKNLSPSKGDRYFSSPVGDCGPSVVDSLVF